VQHNLSHPFLCAYTSSGHYPTSNCLSLLSAAYNFGATVNLTKITGTAAVPAGKVSVYFDTSSYPGKGYATMAQPGFVNPYYPAVLVTTDGPDRLIVSPDPSRSFRDGCPSGLKNACTPFPTTSYQRWFEVCPHSAHLDRNATLVAMQ
jgi:hypothetical protein